MTRGSILSDAAPELQGLIYLRRRRGDFTLAEIMQPGAYIMLGRRNEVLYIGESANMFQRWANHGYIRYSKFALGRKAWRFTQSIVVIPCQCHYGLMSNLEQKFGLPKE